jgi:AcrR family transcriptional regulator
VAARARTSKPVLYRRWKTREDLLLTQANTPRNPMAALVSSMLGSYYEMLMTLKPVPDHVLRQIVDDIFIPLVTPQQPAR